jgi:hypothetical protein
MMVMLNNWGKMLCRSFLLSYIDAGTGSLIIQVLIGSIAGVLLTLKMTWNKLKIRVKHGHNCKEELAETQEHLLEH